jgi:nucleoporin NUP82
MRISVFPLTLRSETVHDSNVETKPTIPAEATSPEKSKWLTPVEGLPPPFVSPLSRDPFEIPPILSGNSLPSVPRHSLPAPVATKEIVLTPDVLVYLLRATEHLSSQVRDINLAYSAVKFRNQLQESEMDLHVKIAGILNQKYEKLKGERKSSMDARIGRMHATQEQLLVRLNQLLAALMKEASPELSEHEVKWFEELKRMKLELLGSGRYDADSLVAKTKQVSYLMHQEHWKGPNDDQSWRKNILASHPLSKQCWRRKNQEKISSLKSTVVLVFRKHSILVNNPRQSKLFLLSCFLRLIIL